MLKANLRKIKSALSKRPITAAVLMAAVLIATATIIFTGHQDAAPYTLRLKNHTYNLESAKTVAEREKGLGGRQNMASDQGMLFVFDTDGRQCFWMKDTHFALDMIWVNSAKKVSAIEGDVKPESYPKVFCHDGRYVIELKAGTAGFNKLGVGQELNF